LKPFFIKFSRYFFVFLLGILFALAIRYCCVIGNLQLSIPLQALISFFWGVTILYFGKKNKLYRFIAIIPFFMVSLVGFYRNRMPSAHFAFANETVFVACSYMLGFFIFSIKKLWYSVGLILLMLSLGLSIFYLYPKASLKYHYQNGRNLKNNLPPIWLKDSSGQKIFFPSLIKQKVVLIDFSFKRCGVCHIKYSYLNSLYEKYKNDSSVVIYRVITGLVDDYSTFKQYAAEAKGSLKIYYDEDGLLDKFLYKENNGYPVEFMLDKNGNINYSLEGFPAEFNSKYISFTENKINILKNEK